MKTMVIRLLLAAAGGVGMAAAAEAGTPGDFHAPGWNGPGGFGPVVRDHRFPPVFVDHRFASPPIVRDHRFPPVHRDHRVPPVVRDHRPFGWR
ncbi:MAG: hypothetical protein U0800_17085 [Isosphaeraceae bacterium]